MARKLVSEKEPFTVRLSSDALDAFAKVAEAAHLDPTQFGAQIIARFGDLKPEFALMALAAIPKEFFKGRPGRPTTSSSRTDGDLGETAA
jgi:hypothetical protein